MRKKVVAGNWKMNLDIEQGKKLVNEILAGMPELGDEHKVIICPPFIHLQQTAQLTVAANRVYTGAQNCYTEASGAYTGEISAAMVKSTGALFVILGHSERREYFNETNAMLAKKVNTALDNNLQVIFCCGEPLEIRDAETQNQYVEQQIIEGMFHLDAEQLSHVTIAYEPIWAIGTGRTATTEQAQDMHAHIRSVIAGRYGKEVADSTSILYGGSCKPSNAPELFACPDVDGGLIGGASLNAADFHGIINAMAGQ